MAAKKPGRAVSREPTGGSSGPATDRHNDPVIDPTENVIALSEASNKRQDDLRVEFGIRINSELRHLREMAKLRAEHSKEIRQLNDDRLEKIRQVDVAAAKTEADRALTAIQALAAVTATNAETLRNQVSSTAAATAKQAADSAQQITERIAALEKLSYEGQGRSKVADPQVDALIQQVQALRVAQDAARGERRGGQQTWGILVAGITVLIGLSGLALAVLSRKP